MDTREENSSSYQLHPVDISCANPGSSDPKPGFEETFSRMGFGCWQDDLGPKGINGGLLMDHVQVWSGVPCTDLLALANAATTTRGSAAATAGEINRRLENQDISFGSGFHQEDSSTPESQQYMRPNGSTYLFDLNSPPTTETEPAQAIPDVVNTNKGETTNLVAKKKDNKSFNLAIEPSQVAVESTEVDTDWDFDNRSSGDETNLIKTPQQPKQRRRKHRPKVVIEDKTKSAKKPKAPKLTGKREYVRKIGIDKLTATPAAMDETSPVRQTRNSCRRKINFDQEWNLHRGDLTFDRAFSTNHVVENYPMTLENHQALSPVTPNKTERPMKDAAKPICSRLKRGMNFSVETHKWGEARGEKRERSSMIDGIQLGNKNATEVHFPAIYKKKRTEKCRRPSTLSPAWSARSLDAFKAPEKSTGYGVKGMLVLGVAEGCRKKRTKRLTRVRDLASFAGMMQGKQWPHQRHTCMEALAADFGVDIPTKKRTKRNSIVPSSLYHNHQFLTNHIVLRPGLRWRSIYDIDALITQFERLDINTQMHALTPYSTRFQEKNALVLYRQDTSLVPYDGLYSPLRRRKPRPKVDLDDETTRVWRLLLEDINSQGIDGTDEEKAKWWEEERSVFSGRAASFIARMHLVQGDRRFSQWKGSVVDSVIGVFLTQNVSDHLSSSAFMSLAARYPLKSTSINEQLQEDISSISINERCQVGLNETISPQNSVDTSLNSVQSSIAQTSERQGSFSMSNFGAELTGGSKATVIGLMIPPKGPVLQSAHSSRALEGEYFEPGEESKVMNKKCKERCASEQSEASAESASQVTVQMFRPTGSKEASKSTNSLQAEVEEIFHCEMTSENPKISSIQHTHENNSVQHKVLDLENFVAAGISEITGSNSIVETSRETAHKVVESNSNDHNDLQTIVDDIDEGSSKAKKGKKGKAKQIKSDWDSLRRVAQVKSKRERTPNTMDSLDYEAVRCADVHVIADTIKERGMNNMLAERIKDFLNRLTRDHGSIDLEWLRDVPPDKAKEYLLSFRGLGLKSVECVRLLTLHHLAFPVDTNVGRIAVRLGWVPLQPLPESLQLHLLELYPVLESIQKYLWPRLCKLDQRTLYELHYQMITFGKVFCTKNKPNCNACPMRGECRHFASAFASARLALPAAQEKGMVISTGNRTPGQSPTEWNPQHLTLPPANEQLTLPPANQQLQQHFEARNCNPVIEEPATPEPMVEVPQTPEAEQIQQEFDMEDFYEDPEEIPTIDLNIEEFTQNLQTYMKNNMELEEVDMSRALVALTSEAASIPTRKLKNVSKLRTEHHVYELPDSHPLLEGMDKREPDDPCSYLLAIWISGETAESIQPPGGQCSCQESGTLCNVETCFLCNSIREANSQTVRGTLLIPCRTAMKGSFPLNGTYFQVNEVFADHDSSLNPIDVPRSWLWNLPRRTVYFGTSIPTIFRGLTTEGIQYCFWRGFVCVRGFDQKTRAPRPLMARLHFPASKVKKIREKTDKN